MTKNQRRLLTRALLIVCAVRIGLSVLPYAVFRARLDRFACSKCAAGEGTNPSVVRRVVQAVDTIAERVPRAGCLVRAYAAYAMLRRRGYCSDVRFGVRKSSDGALEAHAWLEWGGRVILGGQQMRGFVPLELASRASMSS